MTEVYKGMISQKDKLRNEGIGERVGVVKIRDMMRE